MSREEELNERKNDELRELLEEYDQPTSGNKDELVSRILHFELGVSPDEEESDTSDDAEVTNAEAEPTSEDHDDSDDDTAAEAADAQDSPPEDEPEEARSTDQSAEDEGEQVLLRFLGGSNLFEAGGQKFSKDHPFGVMDAEEAQKVTERYPKLFRHATPTEAEHYYS